MKWWFLGTGGAFDFDLGNSSVLISHSGTLFLLDCGHSVYPRLRELGWTERIDYILITHLHDDHCGSLSSLIFHQNLISPKRKVKLLYPTEPFKEQLYAFLSFSLLHPEHYVEFLPLSHFSDFISPIDTYGLHIPDMQTFAYLFKSSQKTILYSGDIADPDFLFQYLKQQKIQPDLIFHDITFFKEAKAHAFYQDVAKYLGTYSIIGYHHDHRMNPADNPIPCVGALKSYLAEPCHVP